MKTKFFYLTKRFLERCPNLKDTESLISPIMKFIEDNNNIEICYLDFNHEIEKNINSLVEFLEKIKDLVKNKYLAIVIYNCENLKNIQKISKYFKKTFYFSELRLSQENTLELSKLNKEAYSLFPVSTNTNLQIIPRKNIEKIPNKNIFISLWHWSDNFKLISNIIKSNPYLNFRAPDISFWIWSFKKSKKKIYFNLKFSNLNIIKSYTEQYFEALNKCDLVLLPLVNKKNRIESWMVWWFRMSNALRGNKYIIMTENYINRIVMAKDNETCLIVKWTTDEINIALKKIYSWEFKINQEALSKIRFLMDYENRIKYIYNYILNYTEEARLSSEKNFKFEEKELNLLKKSSQEEWKEIIEILWIKKWEKLFSWIIYRINLFEDNKIKKISLHILDLSNTNKIILRITNRKQKKFFLKTNNGYYIFFENKNSLISKDMENLAKSIKNIIENY